MPRAILALAALLVAATVTTATLSRGWVDLFKPPYENMPTAIMSLAAISSTEVFVPFMANGAGVSIQRFNGQPNGDFEPMPISGITPIAILSLAAGGTAAAPHGFSAGPDVLGGLLYWNGTSWASPLTVPFAAAIGVAADKATGLNIAFADGLSTRGAFWISNDGGFTFTDAHMNGVIETPNCTAARMTAAVGNGVYYVTWGNFPSDTVQARRSELLAARAAGRPHSLQLTADVRLDFDGQGRLLRRVRERRFADNAKRQQQQQQEDGPFSSSSGSSSSNDGPKCPYSGAVMKSTDNGASWTTVWSEYGTLTSGKYLNQISCSNATTCIVAGESATGVFILHTTDGVNFQTAWSMENTAEVVYSLFSAAYDPNGSGIAFVAGGLEYANGTYESLIVSTKDGGATFSIEPSLDFIVDILEVSWGTDSVAFAAAETRLQAGTILRFDLNGPPQTPAPTYTGNITQKVCPTSGDCTNCTASTFGQNVCLPASGGGSISMSCDMADGVILQKIFPLDATCEIEVQQGIAPFGQCLQAEDSGTIEFLCGDTQVEVSGGQVVGHRVVKMRK